MAMTMLAPTTMATPRGTTPRRDHPWSHEVASGELLNAGLHLDPADVQTGANAFRSVGRTIEGDWKNLRPDLQKAFNLPVVGKDLSAQDRQAVTNAAADGAQGVGFAAAGLSAAVGVYKLKQKNGGPVAKVEGLADIASAGAIATTVAGLYVAPLVLAPLAGALGAVRGGMNLATGYKTGNGRMEVQGALDETRSVGTVFSQLGSLSSCLATTGAVLSGVGSGIQLVRGAIDLDTGVKAHDDRKEVNGLTDIGMAVGGMLSATGVGAIPGVALTVASVGVRLGYTASRPVRAKTDALLDRHQVALQKTMGAVDRTAQPAIEAGRYIIAHVTGSTQR